MLPCCEAGTTLVEVIVGVGVMGLIGLSLYAGFTYSFSQIKITRETLRATQILEERMEMLRLLTWDQVANTPGYVPSSFTAAYFAINPTNAVTTNDLVYTGTVTLTNAPLTESYSNNIKMITLRVTWPSGSVTRSRQMTTFISKFGMQRYVY